MPLHPCDDGLTKECFRAYPAWARQAFAYKLLHILLPKQATKNLPRGLNRALIAPGANLPPGLILPPGSVVNPDASFPPGWTPGDIQPPGVIISPGTIFPAGWTPGDPPPEGVIIPEGTIFPDGWTPGDPMPEGVIIPEGISLTPEDTGAAPPLYVEVFEPGPPHRPAPTAVAAFDPGTLLVTQGLPQTSRKLGDVSYWTDLGMPIVSWNSLRIGAIDLRIGKNNTPTDMVLLEIWRCSSEYKPFALCGGGASTPKDGASLPAFSLGQDYIRFLFPSKPLLLVDVEYAIIAARSGAYDAVNYYKIAQNTFPTQTFYFKLPDLTWYSQSGGIFNFRIWGFLV